MSFNMTVSSQSRLLENEYLGSVMRIWIVNYLVHIKGLKTQLNTDNKLLHTYFQEWLTVSTCHHLWNKHKAHAIFKHLDYWVDFYVNSSGIQ